MSRKTEPMMAVRGFIVVAALVVGLLSVSPSPSAAAPVSSTALTDAASAVADRRLVTMTACQKQLRTKITRARAWCRKVKVIGHRARTAYPEGETNENTLLAFRQVGRKGIIAETDTRRLADGTMVIFHDQTIGRVVDRSTFPKGVTGSTRVDELTREQWSRLRTQGGEPLPTLRGWIRQAARKHHHTYVEVMSRIQNPAALDAWMRTIGARRYVQFAIQPRGSGCDLTSPYNPLRRLHEGGLRVGVKHWKRHCADFTWAELALVGAKFVYGYPPGRLSRWKIRLAHAYGIQVYVSRSYPKGWRAAGRLKVDGIMADRPFALWRWAKKPRTYRN